MDGLVELIEQKKILFIAGAPRSGTTLLSNLLDDHPECLVFPFEHSTLEQFYWNGPDSEFFKGDFINKRKNGQQSILANRGFIKEYELKIATQYNKGFSIDIDTESFKEGYHSYLSKKRPTLGNILRALGLGLVKSNNYSREKIENVKYLVFKQPFFTELFAQFVEGELPNAKFIHIRRDPIARYASAKKRRLIIHQLKNKKLSHINRVNFTLGHTQVDVASNNLAIRNLGQLGDNKYVVVQYEQMLEQDDVFFKNISNYLQILFDNTYFKVPTRLGKPVEAGSVLVTKTGIDKTASKREKQYKELTTKAERTAHKYYLYVGGISNEPVSKLTFALSNFKLHKHSSILHHVFQALLTPQQVFQGRLVIFDKFINKVKEREAHLSGTI